MVLGYAPGFGRWWPPMRWQSWALQLNIALWLFAGVHDFSDGSWIQMARRKSDSGRGCCRRNRRSLSMPIRHVLKHIHK